MNEYVVFGENIISASNRTVAEQFCQTNRFHLLQIGLDTIPSTIQCMFIHTDEEFVAALNQSGAKAFFTHPLPSPSDLADLLAQIKRQRKNSTNGLHNGSAQTHFFAGNKKNEQQPLLKSTKTDTEQTSPGCCAVM